MEPLNTQSTEKAAPAFLGLLLGDLPGIEWEMHDDLCNCIYQRIGFWTNPYLAETHKIRLCCVWARLREMWPDLFQDIPGYFDQNTRTYIEEAREWDGEDDMPRAIWYRQIAHRTGKSLAAIRAEHCNQEPPRGWGHVEMTAAQAAAIVNAPMMKRGLWSRFVQRLSR